MTKNVLNGNTKLAIVGGANSSNVVNYSRTDTITAHNAVLVKKLTALSASVSDVAVTQWIVYEGTGSYQLTIGSGESGSGSYSTGWVLYKDGVQYKVYTGTPEEASITITETLPSGVYYVQVNTLIVGSSSARQRNTTMPSFTIVDAPVVPAGMKALFRYYNSVTQQHICTSDWEELGSTSLNFSFESNLGYMYDSLTGTTNLKPIYRYYNITTGAHYTTDQNGTFTGYSLEKILGYASTVSTPTMSKAATKWFDVSVADHFVCIAPAVPLGTGYTQDLVDFIFGYLQ